MSQTAQTDGGRTDTKRFDSGQFDADDLIEGDRIDPSLVATVPEQLGQTIKPVHPEQDDMPVTQLVAVSATNQMDDVHSAILVDGETGAMVRASRHDSNNAMSQKEADWTVRNTGTKVVAETIHELTLADSDDPVDDEAEYIEGWADIVLGDMAKGHFDYGDDIKMGGSTLTLSDFDGRKGMASITLKDE